MWNICTFEKNNDTFFSEVTCVIFTLLIFWVQNITFKGNGNLQTTSSVSRVPTLLYKIKFKSVMAKSIIHLVFTTHGRRHLQAWFGSCDVTSANIHAIVLYSFAWLIFLTVFKLCIVIEANFYCLRPNWCIEAAICQNGSPYDWYIFIIFAFVLLNLNLLYVSMCTVHNFAQDMKRWFEGGHFL